MYERSQSLQTAQQFNCKNVQLRQSPSFISIVLKLCVAADSITILGCHLWTSNWRGSHIATTYCIHRKLSIRRKTNHVHCLQHPADEPRQSGLVVESENLYRYLIDFFDKPCSENTPATRKLWQERTIVTCKSSSVAVDWTKGSGLPFWVIVLLSFLVSFLQVLWLWQLLWSR